MKSVPDESASRRDLNSLSDPESVELREMQTKSEKKGVHEWIFCDLRDACENSPKARFVACCCASQYHVYAIGKRHRKEFKRVQRVCTKKE